MSSPESIFDWLPDPPDAEARNLAAEALVAALSDYLKQDVNQETSAPMLKILTNSRNAVAACCLLSEISQGDEEWLEPEIFVTIKTTEHRAIFYTFGREEAMHILELVDDEHRQILADAMVSDYERSLCDALSSLDEVNGTGLDSTHDDETEQEEEIPDTMDDIRSAYDLVVGNNNEPGSDVEEQ